VGLLGVLLSKGCGDSEFGSDAVVDLDLLPKVIAEKAEPVDAEFKAR
jgi:hypothetical protein